LFKRTGSVHHISKNPLWELLNPVDCF
jgi:hypothetical protein